MDRALEASCAVPWLVIDGWPLGRRLSRESKRPNGWICVGRDENGAPLYGYLGWGSPRRQDLERLADALQKRHGG